MVAPLPNTTVQFLEGREEQLTLPWRRWFQQIQAALGGHSINAGTGIVITSPSSTGPAPPQPPPITISLKPTGVTPGTYGDATHVSQVTFNAEGQATAAQNVAISTSGTTSIFDLLKLGSSGASGNIPGGPYTDGQLLIGDSVTGALDLNTLTAGANITITNGHGHITIAVPNSAFNTNWFPLVSGTEPPNWITDGAGNPIAIAFTGT
jgi:hypothetical protein